LTDNYHIYLFVCFQSTILVGDATLLNTKFELSMPGFMNIDFATQIRKEKQIGGGGCAILYRGVIVDPKLSEVNFYLFFFIKNLFFKIIIFF